VRLASAGIWVAAFPWLAGLAACSAPVGAQAGPGFVPGRVDPACDDSTSAEERAAIEQAEAFVCQQGYATGCEASADGGTFRPELRDDPADAVNVLATRRDTIARRAYGVLRARGADTRRAPGTVVVFRYGGAMANDHEGRAVDVPPTGEIQINHKGIGLDNRHVVRVKCP
jgi:hypothetical protein